MCFLKILECLLPLQYLNTNLILAQGSNPTGLSHTVNTRQITIGLDGQSVHLLNTAALQSLFTTGVYL